MPQRCDAAGCNHLVSGIWYLPSCKWRPSAPAPTPCHLPALSEDCIIVVDASVGCGGVFPCNVSVALAGTTEANADTVGIWRVPDRSAPLAALSAVANRVALLSGPLAYNASHANPTGVLLIRFTSNAAVTAAGWAASWRALPPPPSPKYCTSSTLTAANGTVEDGSGSLPYGNK